MSIVTLLLSRDHCHPILCSRCQNDGTPYKYICPYPKLWDVNRKECREYGEVDCGVRKEAKVPCEGEKERGREREIERERERERERARVEIVRHDIPFTNAK